MTITWLLPLGIHSETSISGLFMGNVIRILTKKSATLMGRKLFLSEGLGR